MTTRDPVKIAAALERRYEKNRTRRRQQRALAALSDPEAVTCPVCLDPVKARGLGSHLRRHRDDGVEVPLPHDCGRCNKRFPCEEMLMSHCRRQHGGKGFDEGDAARRARRYEYVNHFVNKPYREFLAAIEAPWP